MRPSLFKKQNLNAKQKAILMYWQKTKGVYVRSDSVALEKVVEDKYLPPFTETERELMIDYDNVGELLESYMWTHILDAISLADTSAEKHFSEMISLLQPLVLGIPSLYAKGLQRTGFDDHREQFLSLTLGKTVSHEEGLSDFLFHLDQFSSCALQAIMLNLYMDNVADPLASNDLLVKAYALDLLIARYIHTLDEETKELIMKTKIPCLVRDEFDNNKLMKVNQSEKEMRSLFQPLEIFNYSIQENKLEISREKTLETIEKTRRKAELANP